MSCPSAGRGSLIVAGGLCGYMPTVRTDDIETYYVQQGDGPPVVFVHGMILSASMWQPQLDALADSFTTIAYDVRGHGRTGGSDRERYSVDLFAADLDALVTALSLDRPVICGLSTGGCIAQAYAARHPDRLSGLVLADTFAPVVLDWRDRLQFAVLDAAVLPVRLVGFRRVQRFMNWFHELLYPGSSGDYEAVERLQTEMPAMATGEFAKVIRSITTFSGADVDLSAVAVPTLVLVGENTTGIVKRHAPALAAAIPDAELRAVPGGGHASNVDNPEFFTAAVREFAAGIDRSGD